MSDDRAKAGGQGFRDKVRANAARYASEVLFRYYPDAAANGMDVTWAAFAQRADAFRALMAPYVVPRELCIILTTSQPDAIALFFAISELGGVPAIFPAGSSRQDPERFAQQQSESLVKLKPGLVVSVGLVVEFADHIPAGAYVALDGAHVTHARRGGNVAPQRYADDVLFVQHSSGTTGLKKATPFTDAKLRSQLNSYCARLLASPTDRPKIATWLPLYHDMGFVSNLLLCLYTAGEMAFVDPFVWVNNPVILFRMIATHRSEYVWLPNFAFRHFVKLKRLCKDVDLSSVQLWINCSEPCKLREMEDFAASFTESGVTLDRIKCCYAMAETVFAVSQQERHQPIRALTLAGEFRPGEAVPLSVPSGSSLSGSSIVSNGRPIGGVDVQIMDQGLFLPEGQGGEVCVRGDFVFDGYASQANDGIFHDGYYRTGDLGFLHEGELYIVGRIKDIIIVNGKNYVAHEIEQAVGRLDAIKPGRVVAFGLYSERTGSEELFVVAERASDGALSEVARDELRAQIHLLVEKIFGVNCRDVQVVDERFLVKSSSGKISRQSNAERYMQTFGGKV